ncbi:hypothetical protein Y032_0066g3717 [Ancylostoma ceylanicum]|uniref:Uncharacterized protein n=1 Tax=Ancylostoma ceylanicum TaxID=53326 RepID=A0A016TZT2_9BILA|nr:hypothetical protein Y032_0066g3717 [Ancylostoma ceylanicum]
MADYIFKSSHYCLDEEEKATRCEQRNQGRQDVENISKTIEIFPKLSVSSLPSSENQEKSHRPRKFSKKAMEKDKLELKNQERRILNTLYGVFDDTPDLCYAGSLAMEHGTARKIERNSKNSNAIVNRDGIFNFETYNAVLRIHNPNAIRTNSKTKNAKAVQQMMESVSSAPYVEEIDDSFTYEDLSVMRHPAELHQSLGQISKENKNTLQLK